MFCVLRCLSRLSHLSCLFRFVSFRLRYVVLSRLVSSVCDGVQVDAIIRSGISRFTDEVGRLWCKLAKYYIHMGQFDRARDVYEEAINSVVSV